MTVKNDISPKSYRKSYFALIPILNWKGKQNYHTERNIIKIIRKSDICQSNPILKALLIENVRICCIVIESSGKQSGRILCASAPYILALVSKANPKLGKLLKSEKLSSFLSILPQSDLESLLSHAYQATITVHRGAQRLYPILSVSLIRDSFLFSEESLLYLLKLGLHVLQSLAEWFYDNIRPFICHLYRQNYEFVSFIAKNIRQLIASSLKYFVVASDYSRKAVILIFQFIRKIVSYFCRLVNHVSKDSSLNNSMKKICDLLKMCITYLRSTDAGNHIEQNLLHLIYVYKPYTIEYSQKTFAVVKDLIRDYMPVLKDFILHVFKVCVDLSRKLIDDHLVDILNACNSLKNFLYENRHCIASLCCPACRYFYTSVIYLFNAFQAVLPHIIQFSSNGIIYFIMRSNFIISYCIHICERACCCTASIWESRKELFCRISSSFINFLKNVYEVALEMQPYMVLIFRIIFRELTKLTHVLAPTSLACLQEMNSSLFYASKEVVSKSCFVVKRILPSFYYTVKTVVPPTVQAAREIIKSSTESVVVVYATVFRSILIIRPELEEGIIVLFTDGNKAVLEVISVSFSASCELKDAAVSVSRNLPVFYTAFREVLATTSCAAIEVSVTSLNAKARILKDIKRAHDVVHASFLLAEEEIIAVYMDAMFQINVILSNSSENNLISDNSAFIKKYVINFLFNQCEKSLRTVSVISKLTVNVSANVVGNSALYSRDFIKMVTYVCSCIFSYAYPLSANILPQKVSRDIFATLFTSFSDIYVTAKCRTTPHIKYLFDSICSNLSDIDIKIMRNVCIIIAKVWHVFKSTTRASWNAACLSAPQVWTFLEYLASVFWNICMENIPGLWIAWKNFCSIMWKLINELAPHVWQYSSSVVPVIWSSIRVSIEKLWSCSVDSSSLMWQHITLLSSEYWLLSNTYLPRVWFAGCDETKKGWNVTCCLIENCWTFTVETCLLSWKFLHHSVAKSWRSSLALTKTAYCVLSTSSSVLQKGFYICCKSKNRVCIIIKATPRMNNLAENAFRFPTLRSMLQLTGIAKEFNRSETDTADVPSPRQLRFSASINNCVGAVVNFLPNVEKLLSFKAFIPTEMFKRNYVNLGLF